MQQAKVNPVHLIICAALCLFGRFIPAVGGVTPLGMGILGTFVGAIYGWMTIGLFWPSVMAMFGITLSLGMNTVMPAAFGNLVFFGLAFMTPLIDACNESGAFGWMIERVLTSKALQGKGFITIWILFLACFALGFTNAIIMCLVFCGFVTTICKQVGIDKNDKFPVFVYLGLALSGMLGQILLPFVGTGLTLVLAYNAMFPGFPLDFMSYLAVTAPMGIILITIYVLLMKFVFRVNVSKMANFVPEGEPVPLNRDQKVTLALFAGFIILMVISSLPLGAVSTALGSIGMFGIVLLLLVILDLVPSINGGKLFNVEKSMANAPWGLIMMLAYVMVIATVMNNPATGIAAGMASLLQPFTSLPPLVFIFVALAFAAVMTNFANNMVIIILVMPFMFNFASVIGMAPTGMITLLFIIAQFALATPAASPIAAVAMSNEMADATVMTKAAVKVVPIMFLVGFALGWVLINVVF